MVSSTSPTFLFVLRFINVIQCDPNTSNMDSSVHDTSSLPLSNVCVQFSFAHPHLPLLLASLRFGFFDARPRFCQASILESSPLCSGWCFVVVPVHEVRHLFVKLETVRFTSSCSQFSFCTRYSQYYSITQFCTRS